MHDENSNAKSVKTVCTHNEGSEGSDSNEKISSMNADMLYLEADSESEIERPTRKRSRSASPKERERSSNPSYNNLPCQICKLQEPADTVLICDSCDLGYHYDCLDTPLPGIPQGDWVCPKCTAAGDIDLATAEQSAKGRRDVTLDKATLHYLQTWKHQTSAPPAVRRRAQKRAKRYFLYQDKLYFRSTKNFGPRVVPAIEDRQGIIRSLHSFGHFGIQRTANLVQERCFWAGILQDVTQYVEDCIECRHRNIYLLAANSFEEHTSR